MAIDRTRLPPLNALRGFEAAARHGSFVKAAEELFLSQSAVSHQVRQLEATLGQPLFQRHPRELILTDAGHDLLATVREAFGVLQLGMARLQPYKKPGSLIVSADPAFARLWLLPRLGRFRAAHPGIDVWLDTSERLVDFDRQEVEVVCGRIEAAGEDASTEPLFDEQVAPGIAPDLLTEKPIRAVADLGVHTLLHDERRENWLYWMRTVGAAGLDAVTGPNFSDPAVAWDAMLAGQGVTLVSDALALDAIEAGRVAVPLPRWVPTPRGLVLSTAARHAGNPDVATFVAFLREEASGHAERLALVRDGRP